MDDSPGVLRSGADYFLAHTAEFAEIVVTGEIDYIVSHFNGCVLFIYLGNACRNGRCRHISSQDTIQNIV